jgi:hypothetical protein
MQGQIAGKSEQRILAYAAVVADESPIHRLHSFRLFSSCTVAANRVVQIIENKTKGGI